MQLFKLTYLELWPGELTKPGSVVFPVWTGNTVFTKALTIPPLHLCFWFIIVTVTVILFHCWQKKERDLILISYIQHINQETLLSITIR